MIRQPLIGIGLVAVVALAGCATQSQPAAKAAAPAAAAPAAAPAPQAAAEVREFYVVLPEDGRYYAFGDFKVYQSYLTHGEVALTRTRIGAGPNGMTLVFGITNDDVKKESPSAGELAYDGKVPVAKDFYGEVFKDGRYYVFDDLAQLKDFASHGEVPYSFTDIGVGPNGASLVWVMNAQSVKEGKPQGRMQRFQALRRGS
ncbi:hypothetical protein [Tepidimonas charontis]|uniref:Lipoprotein n=1 Tax=Tepidimonas charontis TaxID=2267262 RepID=A0A554XHG1_9BURK|nr:hypothetical protein [Tepidimonas charontis]TSE35274.1 hypothetical protein Tchar_00885 [Tepidimonas charontis]